MYGAATKRVSVCMSFLRSLQVAAFLLLALDGFEQSFEVSLAEAAAPLALDDFKEECRAILNWASEDLQHVSFVVPVYKNAQLLPRLERFVDGSDTRLQLCVVGVGDTQEVDSLLVKACHCLENVVSGESNVLDS